jgi:cell division protease FtsH
LLGGRAAEQIVLGDISTGASNDIANATEIVKRMITVYGMSDKFKNITLGKGVLGNRGGEPSLVREFSEETQKYIDEELSRIINERYEYVLKTLTEHKDLLEYISNRLKEVETMEGKEFYDIVKGEAHCKQLEVLALENQEKPESEKSDETKTEPKKPRTRKTESDSEKSDDKSEGSEEKPKRTRTKTKKGE